MILTRGAVPLHRARRLASVLSAGDFGSASNNGHRQTGSAGPVRAIGMAIAQRAKAGVLPRATARQATLQNRKADAALAPNQNIENNPMQSSIVVAGIDSIPAKTF